MTVPDNPDGRLLALARRYEPAVVSVVVILVVLLVVPRSGGGGDEPQAFSSPAAPSSSEVDDTQDTPAPVPERAASAFTRPPVTVAPRTTTTFTSTPVPPPRPPRPPSTTSTTQPTAPLEVVETGWSGSDAGLPFSGFDVPDGALPVSTVLGEPDRRSYLRLSGAETVLTLELVQDALGSRFPENAAVWLCPITDDDWEGAPGMTPEEAPAYDCEARAEGEAGDESWTFDLAGLGNPARPGGFALVAADDSSDFQILFADPLHEEDAD